MGDIDPGLSAAGIGGGFAVGCCFAMVLCFLLRTFRDAFPFSSGGGPVIVVFVVDIAKLKPALELVSVVGFMPGEGSRIFGRGSEVRRDLSGVGALLDSPYISIFPLSLLSDLMVGAI